MDGLSEVQLGFLSAEVSGLMKEMRVMEETTSDTIKDLTKMASDAKSDFCELEQNFMLMLNISEPVYNFLKAYLKEHEDNNMVKLGLMRFMRFFELNKVHLEKGCFTSNKED